ncbi:MAG TPA: diadenylate cyclase CdaA [Candidatus Gracilibacteria bacterium]|nr:diadenylate cyclase CdaA [Candidatus Gracilibacteria bacterium]
MSSLLSSFSPFYLEIKQNILDLIFLIFGEIDFSVFNFWQISLDILLFTSITFLILKFIIRVRAIQMVGASLLLGVLLFVSQSLHLVASQQILKWIFLLIIIIIPVMFQNEIRHFFEKMGHSPLAFFRKTNTNHRHQLIKILKQASQILAKNKHGALIVIEQNSPLHIYAETGLLLNAKISKEIILNIFFPKSPLHDGAIIIRNSTILAAGAVLPFTHIIGEHSYGTRHKSALGVSEITDAIVIVVSEERGKISIAHHGEMMSNIKSKFLEKYLQDHLK